MAEQTLAFIDEGISLNYPFVQHGRDDWLNSRCTNDLSDKNVLDCGEITNADEDFQKVMKNVLPNMADIMKNLHPENVAKEATNVANTLSA